MRHLFATATLLLCLAACSVQFVSNYDAQIDTGLSQINTDVTAFVAKMNAQAGTPSGTYAENRDFYFTEEARMDTLILRAQAAKALNTCPAKAVAQAVAKAAANTPGAPVDAGTIQDDDCSVILLQQLKAALVDLQNFHQANGAGGIPAAADPRIFQGGFGSLMRAAITVEMAKKTGQTQGGLGGS
jgi:hypothetical protein